MFDESSFPLPFAFTVHVLLRGGDAGNGVPGWKGLEGWLGLCEGAPLTTRTSDSISTGEDHTFGVCSSAAARSCETRIIGLFCSLFPNALQ